MADKKISVLADAGVLDGSEFLPIVQGGVTKKLTVARALNLFNSVSTPLITLKCHITSAQLLALSVTPLELIPAPGAGKIISLLSCVQHIIFGTVVYAVGSCNVVINEAVLFSPSLFDYVGNFWQVLPVMGAASSIDDMSNKPVMLVTNGIEFSDGDSDLDLYLNYVITDL